MSPEKAVAITLGVTIPCAFIVGILWCYCMSKVCKTDQATLKRPRLSRAHTASRELVSPPRSPQPQMHLPSKAQCKDYISKGHSTERSQGHTQDRYDLACHDNDEVFINDIPIHRYDSDSLDELPKFHPYEDSDSQCDSRSESSMDVGCDDAKADMFDTDSSEDIPPVSRFVNKELQTDPDYHKASYLKQTVETVDEETSECKATNADTVKVTDVQGQQSTNDWSNRVQPIHELLNKSMAEIP